jgi:hypothetical protein
MYLGELKGNNPRSVGVFSNKRRVLTQDWGVGSRGHCWPSSSLAVILVRCRPSAIVPARRHLSWDNIGGWGDAVVFVL